MYCVKGTYFLRKFQSTAPLKVSMYHSEQWIILILLTSTQKLDNTTLTNVRSKPLLRYIRGLTTQAIGNIGVYQFL